MLFAIYVRRKSRKTRGCPDNLYGLVGIFPKRGEENENLPSKSFFLPLPLDLKEAFLSNMSLKYYACHFKTQMTAILPAYFITILLFFQQCICKTINTFSILPNIVYGRHIYCPIIFQETAEIILQYYGKEDFLRKKKCF